MAVRLLARLVSGARDLLGEQVVGWYGVGRREARLAWERRPGTARAVATAAALLAASAGLAAFGAQRTREAALPAPLDWRAAGALLARDAQPGDAVVLSPAWLERAREHVPAHLPIVPAPRPGEPLPGVRRVWLLSGPGLAARRDRAVEADLLARAPRADPQRLGGLQVTRLDLTDPELPLADLVDLSAGAPGLAALREAGGAPRRCLVLQPAPGAPVVREFPALPLGRAVAGHATVLPDGGAGGPLRLAFQVDGEEVGALELRPAEGRRAFQLDTARVAPGRHRVTVVVSGSDARPAPLCLEARTLP